MNIHNINLPEDAGNEKTKKVLRQVIEFLKSAFPSSTIPEDAVQVPDYSKYRMTVQTSKQPVADWSNSSEPLEEVAEGTISELSTPSDLFMRIKRKHGWETIPRSDAELLQKKQGDEHAAD